jgi:hypothetical protein
MISQHERLQRINEFICARCLDHSKHLSATLQLFVPMPQKRVSHTQSAIYETQRDPLPFYGMAVSQHNKRIQ